MISIRQLLDEMIRRGSSDLHITVGSPPQFRIDGNLVRTQYEVINPEISKKLAYSLMTEKQKQKFEENWELDFSFGIDDLSRFRANAYLQKGYVGLALRSIPSKIQTSAELGLPPVISTFANFPRGLVLVTGPTGSGKSTTLASIIDKINEERHHHIMTVEDPIEFVHEHKNCLVNQREVFADTLSFGLALKHVLREDPDVVLIGEMRDLETTQAALTVAETGHLVFATLHTNSAAESINRIIDIFPTTQQTQIRVQLAFVVQAIVTQQLIPKIGGGRCVACEVLMATPAVRAQIREDKVHQIYSTIQAGQKHGMNTMNMSLAELYLARKISLEEAIARSSNITELNDIIARKRQVRTASF
ncbi:PilT/PilU family type 4a pilus ATPase [bacterium]|nr:PilT/PilU family type 4a pilus ATPase [bacterium]